MGNPIDSYCPDVFVTKLNASGTALIYSTYIGGTGKMTVEESRLIRLHNGA